MPSEDVMKQMREELTSRLGETEATNQPDEAGVPKATVEADPSKNNDEVSPNQKDTSVVKENSGDGDKGKKDTKVTDVKQEDEQDDSSQSQTFKVKTVDGEVDVSLDDLKKGFMRQADYTRKTQEVAALKAQVQRAMQDLQKSQSPPEPDAEEPDWGEVFGLDEFATDKERQMVKVFGKLSQELNDVKRTLNTYETYINTQQGREQLRSLQSEFEQVAELRGIPKEHFNVVALYLKEGQRQYGDAYTLESAMADYNKSIGAVNLKEQPVKAIENNPEAYNKLKEKIISEYLESKKQKGESTFTPSIKGGSKTTPVSKPTFTSTEKAKEYILKQMGRD